MPGEGQDQFYANVTAIPEYAALRCNLLLFCPNIGKKELKRLFPKLNCNQRKQCL